MIQEKGSAKLFYNICLKKKKDYLSSNYLILIGCYSSSRKRINLIQSLIKSLIKRYTSWFYRFVIIIKRIKYARGSHRNSAKKISIIIRTSDPVSILTLRLVTEYINIRLLTFVVNRYFVETNILTDRVQEVCNNAYYHNFRFLMFELSFVTVPILMFDVLHCSSL